MARFVGEGRAQEGGDEFLGESDSDDSRAEHEHVHIVMFDALMRGVGIVTESGSDAGDFVGGDGGADTAAADENTSFGFPGDDGFAQGFGEIGVVGRIGVEGADVENIVTELLQEFRNLLFEREAGVIGADCDAHIEHHNTLLDLVSYRRVMLMRNLAIVIGVIACAAGSAAAASCDSMAALKLTNVTVTSAKSIAAGAFIPPPGGGLAASYKDLPEFCRVEGVISPVADSHIEFEVWLPAAGWNNRYLGVGNGGFAGSINYAGLAAGVRTGYAVSSTDTGHKGGTTDAAWALGHFEKIIDYGNRAVHETSDKSKAIIRAFYGSNAKHNYFNGCSNGGRQALMEAQRYPADYDGIIAGAPANYLTHLVADFVGNMQALDASPATYMTAKQLQAVESAAVASCDLDDGVKDGVIGEPTKCKFDPAVLACKAGESGGCLSEVQIAALRKVYEGARNSKGELIHPGYVVGGESGFGGWGLWITGLQQGKSLQHAFGQGFFGDMMFQDPAWDYKKFNFDGDMKKVDDKMGPVFNAVDPNLEKFKSRGGKLVMYHGWSDAAISPVNSVNYYNSVVAKMGKKQAGEFVELYMVPGMQHCSGGPGVTEFGGAAPAATDAQHNMSVAVERWVENGTAPGEIIATKYKADGNPASGVLRTRPICPHPQVAKYKGSGSTDEASNFICAAGN